MPVLHQNDSWLVTMNSWPYTGSRLHFLLIARKHVERIQDLSPEARAGFFDAFDWISVNKEFSGGSFIWRTGSTDMTGASVSHLHAQFIVGEEREEGSEKILGLVGFYTP
jgi:diadenosine tetraphosphate (Ap4A) HIT family hydrolase